jgi:hypothetical protein
MSLFLKEELTVAGHNLIVKERIAEGGFGFVDLVASPQTGQEFVVCHSLLSSILNLFSSRDVEFKDKKISILLTKKFLS